MFCWLVSHTWWCTRVLKGRHISQHFRPLVAPLWGAREHLKNRMCLLFWDALDFWPPLTPPVASSLSESTGVRSLRLHRKWLPTSQPFKCGHHHSLLLWTIFQHESATAEWRSSVEKAGCVICFLDDTFWMIAPTQSEQSIKKRRPAFVREGTRSSSWVSLTLIIEKKDLCIFLSSTLLVIIWCSALINMDTVMLVFLSRIWMKTRGVDMDQGPKDQP